jgi:ribonuclease HI
MKALKFDHKLAKLVRMGQKTTTWRMFDDKDIAVNDVIDLIDKVNPAKPQTWQSMGKARVDSVIEKRLGDMTAEDMQQDDEFTSVENMLSRFRGHYGEHVDMRTPIKVIQFTKLENDETAKADATNTTKVTEVKLYADGGSRGNPGPSASGFAIMDMSDQMLAKKGVYLGITTNNQAEYQALRLGLEEAKKMHAQTVHVYMDSLLVVNQMLGIFKVKNRDLWPAHDTAKQLVAGFARVSFTHVPREFNKIADAAVNEALDVRADV